MKRPYLFNPVSLIFLTALLLPGVSAAQSIYMDFVGNTIPIPGLTDVAFTTAKVHAIESVSWSIFQPVEASRAISGAPTTGLADFSDVTLYRKFDSTSPLFFAHTAAGDIAQKVTLYFMTLDSSENLVEYMKVELGSVVVTSVVQSHERGVGVPYETITLNYGSILITMTVNGQTTTKGWNVIFNSPKDS